MEMLPVDDVNDPRIIARESNFVSINATTEVDLYGQCASETIAGRYWSSSGGQADFARGAMAKRARALIEIAHPDHREALEREAREAGIIPAPAGRTPLPPERRRAHPVAPAG
jgi:acyl-CoA hydrolase